MANFLTPEDKLELKKLFGEVGSVASPALGAAGTFLQMGALSPDNRPNVGGAAIGGAMQGFSQAGILGALVGGGVGAFQGASALSDYEEAEFLRDKNRIRSSTVQPSTFQQGGEVDDLFSLIGIQAEKVGSLAELIILPNLDMVDSKATTTHEKMDADEITDFVQEGSYVLPARKDNLVKLKNISEEDNLLGYSMGEYKETGDTEDIFQVLLTDILGEKDIPFAEAGNKIKKKIKVEPEDDKDIFTEITNAENKETRIPYLVKLMEMNGEGDDTQLFQEGGPVKSKKLQLARRQQMLSTFANPGQSSTINTLPSQFMKSKEAEVSAYNPFVSTEREGQTIADHAFMKQQLGTEELIEIEDPREYRATTGKKINPNVDLMGGEYSKPLIQEIVRQARIFDVDPYTALAVAFQETKFGKTDDNIGHITEDNSHYRDQVSDMLSNMKSRFDLAKKKGVTNEANVIQFYNGTGTIRRDTEESYHGFKMKRAYGVPIPKEGISMKKNPLYGKQIIDLRDNILKKNANIRELVDKYVPKKRFGGMVKKYEKEGYVSADDIFGSLFGDLDEFSALNEMNRTQSLDQLGALNRRQSMRNLGSLASGSLATGFQSTRVDPITKTTSHLTDKYRGIPESSTQIDIARGRELGANRLNALTASGARGSDIASLMGGFDADLIRSEAATRQNVRSQNRALQSQKAAETGQIRDFNYAQQVQADERSRSQQNKKLASMNRVLDRFRNAAGKLDLQKIRDERNILGEYNTNALNILQNKIGATAAKSSFEFQNRSLDQQQKLLELYRKQILGEEETDMIDQDILLEGLLDAPVGLDNPYRDFS